jgi:hypothetical protein
METSYKAGIFFSSGRLALLKLLCATHQHEKGAVASLSQYQAILTRDLQFCAQLLGFGGIGRYGLQAENGASALDIGLGDLTVYAR